MADMFEKLKAPFPPEKVSWRVGTVIKDRKSGIALAYLDARDVMERLDDVIGAANWQDRYEFHGPRTVCYLSIRINDKWVTKADGAGDSAVEAEKGAISDALKRAAVKWGIGRYLYDLPTVWVNLTPRGKSWVIAKGEEYKLEKALPRSRIPETAPPETAPEPTMSKADARKPFTDLQSGMRSASISGLAELQVWGKNNVDRVKQLPSDWAQELRDEYQQLLNEHKETQEAS